MRRPPPSSPPDERPRFRFQIPSGVLKLAVDVLRKADAEHPADIVMRTLLKESSGLAREDGRFVAELVFAWYRWQAWFPGLEAAEGLRKAWEWDERYAKGEVEVSDEELLDKACPAWCREHMQVSAAWLRSIQSHPRLWIRVRRAWLDRIPGLLGDTRPSEGTPCSQAMEYLGTADLFRTPEFHEGAFELQDLSSQWVGHVCDPRPGETWWDACAGEGGKMLHLSDLMSNKGLIWATDRADWRLKRLKQRAARSGAFNYRTAPWDGGEKLPTRTMFDGILLDAPCSGIGTWQRNPHARWTTSPVDVSELAEVQLQLLTRAARALKPGGRLVYSVCTLSQAETSGVADRFQSAHPDLELLPIPGSQPGGPQNHLWIWPQNHRANGMFIASWRKPAKAGTGGTAKDAKDAKDGKGEGEGN